MRWPTTSRLAVYWLAAVVLVEAVVFSLFWHIGDSSAAWITGSLGLMILMPALLIAAVALMVAGIIEGLRRKSTALNRIGIGLTPVLFFVIGVGLTPPIHQGVGIAMTWDTLYVNGAQYHSIIEEVRRGEILRRRAGIGSQETSAGIDFEAERSGLQRVAFMLPDHWLSDRHVILYDPAIHPRGGGSHDVDIAREQASLFDGWLRPYECRRLSGQYLSCYLSRPGRPRGHG